MMAITTSELTKVYGGVTAIRDLDLAVREGEVYGLLGPNGAGKSTTISVLMDYVRPTAGEATVLGSPPGNVVNLHRRVGVLPDRFSLYNRLTGRQHLDYVIDAKNADDDPRTLLERVGLADAADRRIGTYSRGMEQRLALSMGLVGDPELLLLDEPFNGLDPYGVRTVRCIVNEERDKGATVFLLSHVLEQVESVCDRIGILHDGDLVAEGHTEELRADADLPSELIVTIHGHSTNFVQTLRSMEEVESVVTDGRELRVSMRRSDDRVTVIDAISSANITVETVRIREPSIEEIFVAYTDE